MSIVIKPPTIKTNPDREVQAEPAIKVKGRPGVPVEDTSVKPDENKVRAEFKPDEFVRAIQQHGHFVIWEKALICPCFKKELQQADPNCAFCDGSSFYYVDPITIRALVLSVDKRMKLYEKMGTWLQGTAAITCEQRYRLGHRDAIRLRDAIMSFDEIIFRNNRRGKRSQLETNHDAARYRIVHMTFALYLSTTGAIVELAEGEHYELTTDGQIKWLSAGKIVPAGAAVSLRYEFHPIYLIESYPHAIRQEITTKKSAGAPRSVVALPLQSVGQLDYLIAEASTKSTVPSTW